MRVVCHCVLIALLGLMACQGIEVEQHARDDPKREDFQEDDIIERPFRNAVNNQNSRWPKGVIPYTLANEYSADEKKKIEQQMRVLENNVKSEDGNCITFRERKGSEKPHLTIKKGGSCSSEVGVTSSTWPTETTLGSHCIPGAVTHELMHALGFYHEHTRPDRDNYVTLDETNIKSGYETNFRRKTGALTQGLPYDYSSLLQYSAFSSAIDYSKPSMVPKDHNMFGGRRLQLGLPMSEFDVLRIQKYYSCKESLTNYYSLNKLDLVLDCTFETEDCGMTQSTDDDFDMVRRKKSTYDSETAKFGNKMLGNGYYMDVQAEKHRNQKTIIRTPEFPKGYYKYYIFAFLNGDDGAGELEWRIMSNGQKWSSSIAKAKPYELWNRYIRYTYQPVPWYLEFEMRVGSQGRIDMGLDNIIVSPWDPTG